jgi:hypothetical protein
MEDNNLELRMYFFVPYNISTIAMGIQAGHSLGRYALTFGRTNPEHPVWEFLTNHQTWIINNGGTTNDELDFDGIPYGTLNQIGEGLSQNDIEFSFFHEPDLNHALTALCFICDSRVFDKKNYPDFVDYLINKSYPTDAQSQISLRTRNYDDVVENNNKEYNHYKYSKQY